ncbi:hypothetical protein Dsin_022898 [Dipteronia sinensis]|uniref:Importin subunit alpha n=1 Tax=Dipteronia sinensis TaxID=43782 RepID=A0AAE0A298_9ROSI|nr:hypothetical protein Dsin_022898 [Dipteronia sinensis]
MSLRRSKQNVKRPRRCQQPLDAAAVEMEVAFSLVQLSDIPSMVNELSYTTSRLEATTRLRKLLSIERDPPIDEVIVAGVLPHFVDFLGRNDLPELQFEVAWALTNIASGTSDHTQAVIQHGAVSRFVNIIRSRFRSDDLKEQAIWALGNVAGDSAGARDFVLNSDALQPLIALINFALNSSMSRAAVRTLSIFCCGKPPPSFEQVVKPALNILCQLINTYDEEILIAVCKALACISDFTMHRIADSVLLFLGIIPHLLMLLEYPSCKVCIQALRILGNLVTGDDMQTQHVIDRGCLSHLYNLLQHSNRIIRKEACWTISNITAGNRHQIQAVIDREIIDQLVHITESKEDLEINKQAVWAISNAVTGGSHEQIRLLVTKDCIEPLCDFLDNPDSRTVIVCLEGLQKILKVGEATGHNFNAEQIEDWDGFRKIMNLRTHNNTEISAKAVKILETYWDLKGDEEQNQQ